ncbi:MAG: metallophosphoesterase [Deltaproteobacteria bacterium]|nr:metallophosphoesterase [Deltaproteobacteria bacterium]
MFDTLIGVLDAAALTQAWRWARAEKPQLVLLVPPAVALFGLALAVHRGFELFDTMRLASHVLFVHLPLVCVGVALILRRSRIAPVPALAALLLVAIGVDAFSIEPRALEVEHFQVVSKKVDHPIRIGVVADIQVDAIGAHERDALATLAAEKPDLVLFAGDYVQVPAHELQGMERNFNQLLRDAKLSPPLGAFAVEGNAEHGRDWAPLFDGTGIRALPRTTTLDLPGLRLTGLTLRDSFDRALDIPADPNRLTIALGHGPDFALGGVMTDLLIAGHTHGGQVRLPLIGPIMTLSHVPRAWAAGMTALDHGRTLVVSRGVGMERGPAPRLRFLCRPELVIVDVVPE